MALTSPGGLAGLRIVESQKKFVLYRDPPKMAWQWGRQKKEVSVYAPIQMGPETTLEILSTSTDNDF